jgi:hypothetical protein
MWLGHENDALHAASRPSRLEELGELVGEGRRGTLVKRTPSIRCMASLRVAVESPLRARFEVVVFDATSRVLDGPEKFELSSLVLEQPSASAMSDKNPG